MFHRPFPPERTNQVFYFVRDLLRIIRVLLLHILSAIYQPSFGDLFHAHQFLAIPFQPLSHYSSDSLPLKPRVRLVNDACKYVRLPQLLSCQQLYARPFPSCMGCHTHGQFTNREIDEISRIGTPYHSQHTSFVPRNCGLVNTHGVYTLSVTLTLAARRAATPAQ